MALRIASAQLGLIAGLIPGDKLITSQDQSSKQTQFREATALANRRVILGHLECMLNDLLPEQLDALRI